MKSKLCVVKIWPGHMQRLDASCTLGELWRREPGRSLRTLGSGLWTVNGANLGLGGKRPVRQSCLSAVTQPDCEGDGNTDRCFREQHRAPGPHNKLLSGPLGRNPPEPPDLLNHQATESLKMKGNLPLLSEGRTVYPCRGITEERLREGGMGGHNFLCFFF